MKHLIAIFSVILTLGVIAPSDGWGNGKCRPHLCKTDEDFSELLSVDGITEKDNGGKTQSDLSGEMCYHCDINNVLGGIGDDDCGFNTYVATVTASGTKLFMCNDDAGDDDTWEPVSETALGVCSNSKLIRQGIANSTCVLSDSSGNDVLITKVVDGPCVKCSCQPGFKENGARTDCVVDTSAQEKCEESPSYGQWDAANTKCLCGSDRTDGKGGGQIDDVPDTSCKCANSAYRWDVSQGKCIDPYAAQKHKCNDSGGKWNDAGHTCDCSAVPAKGLAGPDGNGECYCQDSTKIYDGAQCVDSPETWCRQKGGEWDTASGTCNCNIPAKNIKEMQGSSPTQCECINADYEFDTPKTKGCKLTSAAQNRITTFRQLKDTCERLWGGTWIPGDETDPLAREPDAWECQCNPVGFVQTTNRLACDCAPGYVLNSTVEPYKCTLSDYNQMKQNCDAAIADGVDVTWKYIGISAGRNTGKCECRDKRKMYDANQKQCVDIGNVAAECNLIDGADVTPDGRCLCRSTQRPPVNNECPTVGGNSGVAQNKAKHRKDQVIAISDKLTEISNGFGRSHWKTASGNFNGARLASDSIAGVVLGTVGGVVTSNIIKKNQVKGGFENLGCSVGGQMVADYGDQFRVGAQ